MECLSCTLKNCVYMDTFWRSFEERNIRAELIMLYTPIILCMLSMYVGIIATCRENYLKYQVMNGQRFLMLGTLEIRSNETLDQKSMLVIFRSIDANFFDF